MQKIDIEALPVWDAADILKTPSLQADYLSLVMDDGNEDEIRDALDAVARARVKWGGSAAAEPERASAKSPRLQDETAAFSVVLKSLKAMGLRLKLQPIQDQ